MSRSAIQAARKFPLDGLTVTYAAGIKCGFPTVVIGFITGDTDVPSVSIDEAHPTLNAAICAVNAMTESDAERARERYKRDFERVVSQVSSALKSKKFTPPMKDTRRAVR